MDETDCLKRRVRRRVWYLRLLAVLFALAVAICGTSLFWAVEFQHHQNLLGSLSSGKLVLIWGRGAHSEAISLPLIELFGRTRDSIWGLTPITPEFRPSLPTVESRGVGSLRRTAALVPLWPFLGLLAAAYGIARWRPIPGAMWARVRRPSVFRLRLKWFFILASAGILSLWLISWQPDRTSKPQASLRLQSGEFLYSAGAPVDPMGSLRIGQSWVTRYPIPKGGVPLWIPLSICTCLALLLSWRDRKRLMIGRLCRTCAYDLTGNVSGRCPECGAVAEQVQG